MRLDDDTVLDAVYGHSVGATGWYRVNCPNCEDETGKPDRKQSFGLNAESGGYHCFKCGAKGYLDSVPEDIQFVPKKMTNDEHGPPKIEPPYGWTRLWCGDGLSAISLQGAREYLHKRGLDEAVWEGADIGAAVGGFYDGRIVVPVMSPEDEDIWFGWVGRDWTGHADLAYRYPKGMHRGSILYNHAALLVETDEPVLIVEGVLDALPYWPNAVACLGKPALANGQHLQFMLEAKRPLAVCLDGDAWREGWSLAMRLRFEGKQAGAVRLPPATDPNDIDRSWLLSEAHRCLVTGE